MGRLIVVLAVVGAAAVVARPSSTSRAHSSAPAVAAPAPHHGDEAMVAAQRDFEKRQAELGLVGAAPLFGAEGLPKPVAR